MKEHPILFSTDMVKAILDGRKTMTRRVIKPQPNEKQEINHLSNNVWALDKIGLKVDTDVIFVKCPYGQVGDRLYIKEGWCVGNNIRGEYANIIYRHATQEPFYIKVDWNDWLEKEIVRSGFINRWRSPLFMPRWASRITLEITEVRVEKVQEITEKEAGAEGFWSPYSGNDLADSNFHIYWDSLNAKRGYGWDINPWVWVISFKAL